MKTRDQPGIRRRRPAGRFFGRRTRLTIANYCAPVSSISAGQHRNVQAAGVCDKVYGSYSLGQIRSQRPSTSVGLRYGDHMHWATTITSTGALLGGLAIVIAFIQLGNQREDQLRAQISKVSVWIQADDPRMAPNQPNGR